MSMMRWLFVLSAALGLAWSVAGCATRQFVRTELTRTEAELRPGVDQLTGDLQEHRTVIRGLAVEVATLGRDGERVTRAAIEALGVADVASGRATDAVEHAGVALARADEARGVAEDALTAADGAAERLTRLWRSRARLSVVEAVVLRFGVDEWVLDDQARTAALDIVRRLRENPALVVELEGYADGTGAPPYNLQLSQLRAEAVRRFLVEQGVEVHRLQTIGLGTARPVADNTTPDGRRQNRRVVLRLLDPS
jgi:outer membrane protein OmpA-like peptidoglycan-associated protein